MAHSQWRNEPYLTYVDLCSNYGPVRAQPLFALSHSCCTIYGWPFQVTLLPLAATLPNVQAHLSPISAPEESYHALIRGSVAASICSCEVTLIVLSASILLFGLFATPQPARLVPVYGIAA